MLNLQHVALRRGNRLLFENASFQIHAGQRLGLIGANGSGKSSLFALLLGQIESDSGDLRINPNQVIAHVRQESPDSADSSLDYVMDGDTELRSTQRAIESAEKSSANDNALHSLYERMEDIDGYTAESRAGRLLHGLGFSPEDMHKPVRDFSGGWRMRLNLAQALMCRSDILLLDEPTNHLDLPAILWLERQLRQYEGILMVVSHDRDFLDGVCTRIAHIEHQTITLYTGDYSQFEALRAEQLAQQQALFSKQQKDIKHLQSYVDRFRYKASKAKQAQSRLKMMERMTLIAPAHADSQFRFHFLPPLKQPQHLLKLTDASLGYEETVVLDDVNMSISAGDRLGLLGVNGAGKSTLVKALCDGTTLLSGERVNSKDTRIGYFAQHQLELLQPDQSPYDHLREFAPNDKESELRNYLGRFGFGGERIFDPVAPFSGGEKARLVLALMIRQQPNLLLLDEPTNHLDLEMRQALSVALIEYTGALVVISHDRHLLRSVCDELRIVHNGCVDEFNLGIDDYPAWLREQEQGSNEEEQPTRSAPQKSRKQTRQAEANRRKALKPLSDRVRAIEKKMTSLRNQLEQQEEQLADENLYSDTSRQEELTALVKDQSRNRGEVEQLEWEWLEASEALEIAASELQLDPDQD